MARETVIFERPNSRAMSAKVTLIYALTDPFGHPDQPGRYEKLCLETLTFEWLNCNFYR